MISFRQFFTEGAGSAYNVLAKGIYMEGDGLGKGHRPYVVLDLGGGRKLMFYQSSKGTRGKVIGTWYPFFGIGNGGYVLKGELDHMEVGYGNPEIKQAMEWLNKTYQLVVNTPDGKKHLPDEEVERNAPEFWATRNIVRTHSKLAYGKAFFSKVVMGSKDPEHIRGLHNHIGNILTGLGFKYEHKDYTPSAPPEVPQPDSSQPGQGGALTLIGRAGGQLTINLKTAIGKSVLAKQFGPDAQFFSEPQFMLDKDARGAWTAVHNPSAQNATLLNNQPLPTRPQPLSPGDVLAVGNVEKGIVKVPMTVQLS